jgi:DNA polymerase V
MLLVPVRLVCKSLILPFARGKVKAGFPSYADDFGCKPIDLTEILVKHPQATFMLRASGDSMRDAGIFDGDALVVDKAIKPRHDHIVVAVVDGEFTVKRLYERAGRIRLRAANPTFADIIPSEGQTIEVWGVVTSTIKQFKV